MSEEDDAWALDRLTEFPELVECVSVRVMIDGITHRALSSDWTGWRTLCRSHDLVVFPNRTFAITGRALQAYDLSSSSVDCLCCIPAGG
jgi:hypothetical protein